MHVFFAIHFRCYDIKISIPGGVNGSICMSLFNAANRHRATCNIITFHSTDNESIQPDIIVFYINDGQTLHISHILTVGASQVTNPPVTRKPKALP